MDGLVADLGRARFIVGAPHPRAQAAAFAQAASLSPEVRAALRGTRHRLLHAEPVDVFDLDPARPYTDECEAVFYDYTRNRALRVRGAAGGVGPLRITLENDQPRPSPDEWAEAVRMVAQSPVWGPILQSGEVRVYDPMPPNLEPEGDEEVERTLFVGMYSRAHKFNRIVAVNMVRREVSRSEVTPRTSLANLSLCGPDVVSCNRPARGTPGAALVQWPAPPATPLWTFEVIRPAASSGTNGSGVELRNVKFRGRSVLRQAHVPLLNVKYDGDTCGPYRDWLYEETCFDAVGTNVPGTQGIRWCTQPPQTIFEKDADGGNFVGVALWEHEDGSLRVLSQCAAGWYRYATEWRFYPDGVIQPRFRFGAVADSCTCNAHNHHAYWRFDWEILDNKNTVEELQSGVWTPLKKEISRKREVGSDVQWRVRHHKQELGYQILTGADDSVGDAFSGDDCYLIRRRNSEVDDGQRLTGSAQARISRFVKGEKVLKADLVTWYVAHFYHTQDEVAALDHSHGGEFGPTLQPFNWPDS